MNTQDLLSRIAAANSHVELNLLKDEAWEHPDFDVWSAFVDRSRAINAARTAATERRVEAEVIRQMHRSAADMAALQHAEAVDLAARLHREANDRFQQQCDLNHQIHMTHHGF